MPKREISRREAMLAEHAAFLRKMGVGGRRKLTGFVASPLERRGLERTSDAKPSDTIPGNGTKGRALTPAGDRIIGQPYNKGPFMVLGSKEDLQAAKRRDR